jgi:hypothetical protein
MLPTRRQFHGLLLGGLAAGLSGCGTLMYPERRGQGRTGGVDWTVAGMDAIGLVFFFVPGVIAFAVDYYNGSLFYPEGSQSQSASKSLRTTPLPGPQPTWDQIVETVRQSTGHRISIREQDCIARRMNSLDEFWQVEQAIAANDRATRSIRCQSPDQ